MLCRQILYVHVKIFVNFVTSCKSRCCWLVCTSYKCGLLLGVEDTGLVTIGHRLTKLLFLLFSSFFRPFVPYCFTSTVSSTPSRSPYVHVSLVVDVVKYLQF